LHLTSIANEPDGKGAGDVNEAKRHARQASHYHIKEFSNALAKSSDVPAADEDAYVPDGDSTNHGGECTCPSGITYQVGAINGDCNYLACDGGTPGTCYEHQLDSKVTFMKVTCAWHLPRGKRWVLLTRGQAFRAGGGKHNSRTSCEGRAIDSQLECSQTFVDKIIEPLESLGNTVTVVFTSEPCPLNDNIKAKFGRRLAKDGFIVARNQADGVRFAFDTLNEQYGGPQGVAEKFDYVVMARNDLCYKAGITNWLADFDKFNFFMHCEGQDGDGSMCAWDFLHTMPSRFYAGFNRTSTNETWCGSGRDGHGCWPHVIEALRQDDPGAEIGFLYDRDHRRARAGNPYVGALVVE